MVKMDGDWNIVDSKIIAGDKNEMGEEYTEGYVTGMDSDDDYFYISYNRRDSGGMASVIKIFDKRWNVLLTEEYKEASGDRVRPSLYLDKKERLLYAGNNGAGIYFFKVK